jgi:hypothetical protein
MLGEGEVGLAVGFEKMRDVDGKMDGKLIGKALGLFSHPDERPGKVFVFPHLFAEIMKVYMDEWGVTEEDLAAIAVASALALVALLSGCSAREALRNSVRPLGLYEVQHPLHGGCHELGVRAHSDTLNRAVVVYGGVCVGINDSGAAADAAVSE